jgi:hypothetical protein
MSSPKDKAIELVNKFSTVGLQQREEGIACALIAVDEILIVITECETEYFDNYWQEVKQEIQKL